MCVPKQSLGTRDNPLSILCQALRGWLLLAGAVGRRRGRDRLRLFLLFRFPEGSQLGEGAERSRSGQGGLRQVGLGRLTARLARRRLSLALSRRRSGAARGAALGGLRRRSAGTSTAWRQWPAATLLWRTAARRRFTSFAAFAPLAAFTATLARLRLLLRRFALSARRDHRQRNPMTLLVHRQH